MEIVPSAGSDVQISHWDSHNLRGPNADAHWPGRKGKAAAAAAAGGCSLLGNHSWASSFALPLFGSDYKGFNLQTSTICFACTLLRAAAPLVTDHTWGTDIAAIGCLASAPPPAPVVMLLHTSPIWGLGALDLTRTSSRFWTYVKGKHFLASLPWQWWTFLPVQHILNHYWILLLHSWLAITCICVMALKIQTKSELKPQNKVAPPYCRLLALLSIYINSYCSLMPLICTYKPIHPPTPKV